MALYPMSLRKTLGMSEHTTSMSFGVQLANYKQLRDACDFLEENGVRVDRNPPAATRPGMDYVAHAFDADGHCIQLYHYMEQIGWDGKVRPAQPRDGPSRRSGRRRWRRCRTASRASPSWAPGGSRGKKQEARGKRDCGLRICGGRFLLNKVEVPNLSKRSKNYEVISF